VNGTAHSARLCALAIAVLLTIPQDAAARTIPVWSSSFSFNGIVYNIQLVGSNPTRGGTTTFVANAIVPMKVVFADGTTLDASRDLNPLLGSPIYQNAAFQSGTTQYADAVLRAELWPAIQGSDYHVLLATPFVEPLYLLQVPAEDGSASTGPRGEVTGTVDYDWFVKVVQPAIVVQLGVSPTSLTIFLTHNIRLKQPGNTCCFHGNHTAFYVRSPAGRDRFTTVWAGVDSVNVSTMSHEINEWANDPFNENLVPGWRNPESGGCDTHLEVGDPLAGVTFRAGGYFLQDIAYVQWFSRQQPSLALGGQYDVRGKLTSAAADCKSERAVPADE
jgi:hypothetical protein